MRKALILYLCWNIRNRVAIAAIFFDDSNQKVYTKINYKQAKRVNRMFIGFSWWFIKNYLDQLETSKFTYEIADRERRYQNNLFQYSEWQKLYLEEWNEEHYHNMSDLWCK